MKITEVMERYHRQGKQSVWGYNEMILIKRIQISFRFVRKLSPYVGEWRKDKIKYFHKELDSKQSTEKCLSSFVIMEMYL